MIPQRQNAWILVGYALMIVGSIAAFLLVRAYGEKLAAPPREEVTAHASKEGPSQLFHVLLALTAVIVLGLILGRAFRAIGQPPVIGEVMAGILLGPSLLGRISPDVSGYVLPASIEPLLGTIAQLGVILYMFLVGLELNADLLRQRGQTTLAISHASIAFPFMLGALLALALYPRLSNSQVPFTSFALFLGVAMSITAFPVLARILTDRRMSRTELGALAMACAATDDVTAWCLLAFVVGVAQAKVGGALLVAVLTGLYIAFMFVIARPAIAKLIGRYAKSRINGSVIALVFVGLLASTMITEVIGVHAIFGAFLFGAIFPHESQIARLFIRQLENVVTILLLPAFFAFTGMRTQIGLVSGWEQWLLCGIIILVATVGKFGGTFVAARLTGIAWRPAAALGVLMNTRGLMELIVLNVGLDLGVISPTLFAMMVLMALATTIATSPLLQFLSPREMTEQHASPHQAAVVESSF